MVDYLIVGLYLIITLVIGLYVGRKTETIKEYAVGQRNFSTPVLVAGIFATVVDASDTIGLAENTFLLGPIFLCSYMGMAVSRFLTAYLIAPRIEPFFGLISSGDILEKLYGRKAKTLMGLSTLIETTLLSGAQILAIAHLAQYFFKISSESAAVMASLFIILYSFRGGIKSVTATDVLQFGILIIAIPIVCAVGLIKIGGHEAIISTIQTKGLSFTKDINIGQHLAVFISFSLPCLYPLCIQRMLMAKNTAQIKSAFIANGLLTIPFQIIVGTIGIIALILLPDLPAAQAFPALIDNIVPTGLKGIVISGLLAVIMSTVDSILNTGAIAGINDLLGSLVKSPISSKAKLTLAKLTTIAIALGATVIAVKFNSIIEILFFVLVLGNSIYFPGYFLGILRLQGSKRAFWVGVFLGFVTIISGIVIFKMFILNVMLLAIALNASAHLFETAIGRYKKIQISLPKITGDLPAYSQYLMFNNWLRAQEYCNIFAVCSIGLSLFYFFGPEGHPKYPLFLVLNAISAACLFLILFRELWSSPFLKLFPLIWTLSLVLALPLQTLLMFIKTDFSILWLIDSLTILPLLSILTSRKGVILSYLFGFLGAYILNEVFPDQSSLPNNLGQFALFAHMIILAICLAFFRKKDAELCKSTSSTLVHEANRSLTTFENAATYYESYLPSLIQAYQEYVPPERKTIPTDEIDEMLHLPATLKQLSQSTRNALLRLHNRMSYHTNKSADNDLCNINECVKIAIEQPLFAAKKHIIEVIEKQTLFIHGDRDELTQVFINLIENSICALKDAATPHIAITIDNATVSISDNGEGISDANLPNIFDEGFSTKLKGGQGLFYCKNILNEHDASIRCHSIKSSHTQFDILFKKEASYEDPYRYVSN